MEEIYANCCGLDVHKETVVACRRTRGKGGQRRAEVRTFGTMTGELLELSDWLAEAHVTHVAMESTGVYWKPVFHILEGLFQVLVVNAYHVKQVAGRKTDVKDCEWIAELLEHGLLRSSFVPPQPIRELRDLTRMRAQIVAEKTSVANRIHKVLEDANIKLAVVASDILGVSGRKMLEAIIAGEEDPDALADLAVRRLRGKIPKLRLALKGKVTDHHRFLLKTLYQHLGELEALVARFDARIAAMTRPLAAQIQLLQTIPGVQLRTAENLIAEIGVDMTRFPSACHLASWAGVSPGNNESAGKRKSGKTPKANRWLKRCLTEAAWAASRTKGTYPMAQYRRLVPRRGKKRAIVAVGHSLLIAAYHMLKAQVPYRDLGASHFDRIKPEAQTRYHIKRLEQLGFQVTIKPQEAVA